jgi:predicted  nucleic acid-binding Zn-ribbon protein
MPRIIARRYINICWGDRAIYDNQIDYDLYNNIECLNNGGGKTVQIFLLNCLFTHPRYHKSRGTGAAYSLADYFQEGTVPGIVMVEILMDQSKKRLLVGMLARKVNGTLDQHNFIYAYKEAEDPLGIRHIPLVSNEGDTLHILSMDQALDLLEAHHFHVYDMTSANDPTRYYKELISYKISPSQWEDVVLKINQAEGGISKFFSGLDEPAIIRDWLFKVIEEKLKGENEGESTRDYLKTAFYRLCEKRRLVDHHLKTEELTKAFIEELTSQKELFEKEQTAFALCRQSEKSLSFERTRLETASTCLEEDLKDLNDKQEAKKQDIIHIRLEQESKTYHERNEEIRQGERILAVLRERLDKIREQYEHDCYEEGLQKYAKTNASYRKEQAKVQGYQEALQALSHNEDQRLLNDLGYSLKVKTLAYQKALEKEIDDATNQLKEINESDADLEAQSQALAEKMQELIQSTTRLNDQIEAYKSKEETFFGAPVPFNLMGEHEDGFFVQKKKQAALQSKEAQKQKGQLEEQLKGLEAMLDELEQKHNTVFVELGISKNDLEKAQAKCDEDEKIVADRQAHFPDYDPLDVSGISAFLEAERKRNEEKSEESRREKEADQIAYGQLSSNLNKDLSDFLTHHDIHFIAGMDYLRGQSDIAELITINPMLSYAFVIDDQDFEALSSLELPTVLEPAIFMKRSGIGKKHQLGISDDTMIYVRQDETLLDEEAVQKKRESLEKAIAALEETQTLLKEQNEALLKRRQMLLQQNLDRPLYEAHRKQKADLTQKIEALKTQKKDLEDKQAQTKLTLTQAQKKLSKAEKQLEKCLTYEQNVESLEKEYGVYLENLHHYEDQCTLYQQVKEKQAGIKAKQSDLRKQEKELSSSRAILKERLKQSDIAPYASYEEGDFIDEAIDVLKSRFEVLKDSLNSDEKHYHEMIALTNQNIEALRQELAMLVKNYTLEVEQAQKTVFDDARLEALSQAIKKEAQSERELAQKESRQAGTLEEKKKNKDRFKEEILALYHEILPVEEIYGQFEKRIRDAKEILSSYEKQSAFMNDQLVAIRFAVGLLEDKKIEAAKQKGDVSDLLAFSGKELQTYEKALLEDYNQSVEDFQKARRATASSLTKIHDDNLEPYAKNMVAQLRRVHEEATIVQALNKLETFIEITSQKFTLNQNSTKEYHHDAKMLDDRLLNYLFRIHQGLNEIDRHTAIEFGERKRKLVTIETASWEDQKELIAHKIEAYIDAQLEESLKIEDDEKLKQFSLKVIAPVTLYDQALGIDTIRLYALKVGEDHQRRYRWDTYRSGAEGTVSSMALLGALLSYLGTDPLDSAAKRAWTVLVMDNPFAEMVNNHLVRAFLLAAKSLHVQLILFTGTTQESVIKEANRVIISRVGASGAIGIEEVQKNHEIEAIGLTQQMSLFDL